MDQLFPMPQPQPFVTMPDVPELPDHVRTKMRQYNADCRTATTFFQNHSDAMARFEVDDVRQFLRNTWPQPLTLKPDVKPPVLGFDYNMASAVSAVTEISGYDYASSAIAFLSAVNTALCGRYRLHINKHWHEEATLYVALINNQGSNKSLLFDTCFRPLKDFNAKIMQQSASPSQMCKQDLLKRAYNFKLTEVARSLCREHQGKFTAESVEAFLDDSLFGIHETLEACSGEPIFIDDMTCSSLYKRFRSNNCFAAVAIPEGGALLRALAKDEALAKVFLQSFGGESFDVSRAKHTFLFVRPIISLCMAIQDQMLRKYLVRGSHLENGLASRLFYWFANQSSRPTCTGSAAVTKAQGNLEQQLTEMVKKNYELVRKNAVIDLFFEDEATFLLQEFRKEIYTSVNMLDDSRKREDLMQSVIASIFEKSAGLAARFAATMHCFAYKEPQSFKIDTNSVKTAIKLVKAGRQHAEFLFGADNYSCIADARKILMYFYKSRAQTLTATAIAQQTAVKGVERIHPALDTLQRKGYIYQIIKPGQTRLAVLNPWCDNVLPTV